MSTTTRSVGSGSNAVSSKACGRLEQDAKEFGLTDGPVDLPAWIRNLRKAEVTDRVRADPRSTGRSMLGMDVDEVRDAIGGGQADFDAPRGELMPDDLALLYAYLNQLGHVEELVKAFGQFFEHSSPPNPIVLDVGCGPFTGGLALAATLKEPRFDYIGVDPAESMRHLGEQLACSNLVPGEAIRHWAASLDAVEWPYPPSWRDVVVIVSYVFASPTLDGAAMFRELVELLGRLGKGGVTLLYTNSVRPEANRAYPAFRDKLLGADFRKVADGEGEIVVERLYGPRRRPLRYAMFRRDRQEKVAPLAVDDCAATDL